MICNICGGQVEWKGPRSNLPHTECANCGGINCQKVGEEEIDLDTEDEPDNVDPK